MKNIQFLLIISFLLASCGGLKDAGKVLRNEKIKTTDEFLVKKRNPLVLPPDFEKIPEPGSNPEKKTMKMKILKEFLILQKMKTSRKTSLHQ